MFLSRFPLQLIVVATINPQGQLQFLSSQTFLRYGRIPGYPDLVPKFLNGELISEPWSIEAAAAEGPDSARFRLQLNGQQLTAAVNTDPNNDLFVALLDQAELHLPFKLGPIPPEDDCGDEYLRGVAVLKPCLVVLS